MPMATPGLSGTWNDVYAGVNLSPFAVFKHNFQGERSHQTGNFVEGAMAYSVGLRASYLNSLEAEVQYTELLRCRAEQQWPRPRQRRRQPQVFLLTAPCGGGRSRRSMEKHHVDETRADGRGYRSRFPPPAPRPPFPPRMRPSSAPR